MSLKKISALFLLLLTFLFLSFFTGDTKASHSWGNYHWARTSNPFTLRLGDNLTSSWDPYLVTTSTDWSASSVLDTVIVPGTTTAKRCKATNGMVEVCNSKYGRNGWLGVAQIWISGGHITQGITKVNDTYFNTSKYNTPAWKNLVMCQEVGHTLGLDHQDEEFDNANLGTCMDYTSSPESNQHPNGHDYEQLESIYEHLDSFTTLASESNDDEGTPPGKGRGNNPGLSLSQDILNTLGDFENRSDWGRSIRDNGHVALFERDLGLSNKLFTFVIWAQE